MVKNPARAPAPAPEPAPAPADKLSPPNPIELFEAACAAAMHPDFSRNGPLRQLVQHWQVEQTGVKAMQARLDERKVARVEAALEAAKTGAAAE